MTAPDTGMDPDMDEGPPPRAIPYATPEALRAAVSDRAKDAAAAQPHYSVAERQRQFAYGRLLARVFSDEPERWVLKGGAALLARLPDARHSPATSTCGVATRTSTLPSGRWSGRPRSTSATT